MFFAKKDTPPSVKITLPLLPLRDIVVFPHMVVPLFVGRDRSVEALEAAMKGNKNIFLSSQKNAQQTSPGEDEIYELGTVGHIIQMLRLPDSTIKVFVEGRRRARIRRFIDNEKFFHCEVEVLEDIVNLREVEVQAMVRGLKGVFLNYVSHNKKVPQEFVAGIRNMSEPSKLADSIAGQLNLKLEQKQSLLECVPIKERVEQLLELMQNEIEIAEIEKKIRERVKKGMEKSQKEYYLNEQMRAIQKEMGDKDDFKSEIAELEEQIAKKELPSEADAKVKREMRKLKLMSPMSAEATVVRNYVDWFLALPWSGLSRSDMSIDDAQRVLDEDHYALKEVKERIIEYLAVQRLANKTRGPILCLVGPPGVGKTSLAKSVSRATGREFIRISLGGVRDEAEIRGHRRTYIGALPGKIIQSMRKIKTVNPVMLLDEVDKMSMDFRGDPSAALLEVLDPEQNHAFNDHYLDVDYDLSQVMFITTANTLHGIPAPLQDRMEIIRLPGYTEVEKLKIGERFLVSKQQEANGLTPEHVSLTSKAIVRVIRRYTREAGVRNLERQIAKMMRKVTRQVVDGTAEGRVEIDHTRVGRYLGVPKFRYRIKEEEDKVGIATGLAWTEAGGEILIIEVALMPGSGKLMVTGKLGEVMQESARAAMSYVRSRAWGLGLKADFYNGIDIHIHVPEGATPKDGPSAGITIACAIVSGLTKQSFPSDLAMTGEITLRGRVLPIGGLKEKLLAAKRGLITRVIIPQENEGDLYEIPKRIRKGVEIIPLAHMDEVLRVVFSTMEQTVFSDDDLAIESSFHLKQ